MDEEQKRLAEELLFSDNLQVSFAKKLYFGLYDASAIFPYCKLPEEQKPPLEALLQQLKAYMEAHIDPVAIDKTAHIPESVIQGLAEMGIFGLTVPKLYGGLGMSQFAYCKVLELLAGHCASTALIVNVHQSIGLKAVLLFGTEEQRRQWLPPLAKGTFLAAFSLTEANAGSDASNVETTAVYDPLKNVYRLNGKKQWTTNGSIAKILTVMAKTEVDTPKGKQQKITAFLVTPDMPGFQVTAAALEKVGLRGTKTANLAFNDMEVPAQNILGPTGGGLRVCLTCLDYGRTAFGASCTGVAKFLVQRALEHASSRIQFKHPLAALGLIKQKIALMSALTYAMDATTYMTAGLIDAKNADIVLEASILKVFNSEALWTILYDTMQIYGGRSFFTEAPFERIMRDARLNMIGEGSNELLRVFIGVVGMRDVGLHLQATAKAFSNPIANFSLLGSFARQAMGRLKLPQVPVQSPLIADEAKRLARLVRRFGFGVVSALARYKEEIVEQQHILNRIANVVIAIYTTSAVLSKLDSDLVANGQPKERLENDTATAKFYCQHAMGTAEHILKHLFLKEDAQIEALSDRLITSCHPRSCP